MADTKISALTDIVTLAAGDEIPVADASDLTVTKSTTPAEIATYVLTNPVINGYADQYAALANDDAWGTGGAAFRIASDSGYNKWQAALRGQINNTLATARTQPLIGLDFTVAQASGSSLSKMYGVANSMFLQGANSTIGDAMGTLTEFKFQTNHNGMAITNAYSFRLLPVSSALTAANTGTITNLYGFYMDDSGTPTNVTITNRYGVYIADPLATSYFAGNVQIADKNLILGTTTGTKIGTATTQKLGFFNATPVVQPTGDVLTALSTLGLVASPTLVAADVPNGITTVASAIFTQSMAAGTYYYVTGSDLTMPATAKAGMSTTTTMQWQFHMQKTAAGTAAFNVCIYRGTNGTTADTRDVTQSIGTATAVVDHAIVTVTLKVTATGATGSYTWGIAVMHKAATAAGFGTTDATPFWTGTVSSVAMNTASLKFGIGLMGTTGTTAITLAGLRGNVNNMS